MAEYIYFIASLPYLSIDRESPFDYETFLTLASEQLSVKDYLLLKKATFDHEKEKVSSRIISDWDDFNYSLNEYLTEERAKKLGKKEARYNARCPWSEEIQKKAEAIVRIDNPLEAEKAILKEYFSFLSSHEVDSQFSLDALIIYGLLLQIKERVSSFDSTKGREEFDRLYQEIRKDISLRSNL